MSYRLTEQSKQNAHIAPSLISKGKIEEFRNNFFKNISNQMQDQSTINEDRIDKKNYSVLRLPDKVEKVDKSAQLQPRKQNKLKREFDARLDNIDKIHSKIQDLLQFVKQKKYLDKTPTKAQEDSIEVMRAKEIQKIKSDLYGNSKQSNKHQQSIEAAYPQPNNYYKQSNKQISTRIKKPQPQPQHHRQVKQKLNKQDYFIPQYKKQLENNKYANLIKTPQKYHEKTQKQTPYRFIQQRDNQIIKVPGSIDDEIKKIKGRIQQSELERKKLSQKYSEYSQFNQNQKNKIYQQQKKYREITEEGKKYKGENETKKYKGPEHQTKNNRILQEQTKHIAPEEELKKHNIVEQHRKKTSTLERRSFVQQKTQNQFKLKLTPCQNDEEKKQETKILAEILANQVHYDKKVKQARQEFSSLANSEKWEILKEQLESKGLNISIKQLEQQMSISSDEHNPFQKQIASSNISCIGELASSYIQSLAFWKENLVGCVSLKRLEQEGFNIKDLDLDKKGNLSIEDFVCFINLFSGNFFRNRDVLMLYRRFLKLQQNNKNSVEYQTFINTIRSK